MSIVRVPFSLTGGGAAAYVPAGAIWLDGSADYLSRTPSSVGNTKLYTLSWWQKAADTKDRNSIAIFAANKSSDHLWIGYDASRWYITPKSSVAGDIITTAVDRDFSAWKHVVVHVDTANANASSRLRIWINGAELTDFDTDRRSSISDITYPWNNDGVHYIGADTNTGPRFYFNGYLAEIINIDGTLHDPTDFGEYDANGNWVPIDPSGLTFGTNGFWLDFADSADLGNDVSGNGNDWTLNSITSANSTSDRPADDAANDLGNYNTVSTLFTREVGSYSSPAGSITTSNGNLTVDFQNGGTNPLCITTQVLQPGKKYHFEWTTDVWGSDSLTLASVWLIPLSVLLNRTDINSAGGYSYYIPSWNPSRGIGSSTNFNASNLTSMPAGDAWNVGEVISLDIDMSTIGSTNITAKLDGTTVATDSSLAFLDEPYVICPQVQSNSANRTWKGTFNFGASAFATTPLTDHVGVYTSILPAPTVTDPSAYFQSVLYTGNGTAIGSGGKAVTGVGFQPDFVWIKNRDAADSHMIFDAVRGVTKYIESDTTDAEAIDTESLSTFDTDGFTVGNNLAVNTNTEKYVAWCLKAGGAGSANTNGTITSTVSVAAHGGFSIGTYTGTGANATVGHGLSSNPDFFIIKCADQAYSWACWHKDLATGDYVVYLNTTAAQSDQGGLAWQSNPIATSGVITLGSQTGQNSLNDAHVFYAFARTPGLIGIGSYVGNGNADGPYVVVDDGASGFRPAFVMVKRIDAVEGWSLLDAARDPYNKTVNQLQPNTSNAESGSGYWDFTANGFKAISTAGSINTSAGTYIYLAFAEYPFGGDGVAQAKAR